MVMNYGNGYPMIGMQSMYSCYNSPSNINNNFKNKYGCKYCDINDSYWKTYPKPITREPEKHYKPSFLRRIMYNIFGNY